MFVQKTLSCGVIMIIQQLLIKTEHLNKTCLIFATLDWADFEVIATIANESEPAS